LDYQSGKPGGRRTRAQKPGKTDGFAFEAHLNPGKINKEFPDSSIDH
jgi:hypothetical protein